MLIGVNRKPASKTETILDRMESSTIRFFLTGSRFFGWERPDSDWDFFTESSTGVATTLRLLGFYQDTTEGYQDGLTRQVFIGHSIHVQLVNSVIRKQELNLFFGRNRRLLAVPSYGPHMELIWTPRPKEVQRVAWQTAVTMYLSHKVAGV